jgi:hypothetical protein
MKKILTLLLLLVGVHLVAQTNTISENNNLLFPNLFSYSGNCETSNQTFLFSASNHGIIEDKPLQTGEQTNASRPCDCNTDMYVIANPGGWKVRCHETKFFEYGTTVTIMPQNICNPAQCLGEWTMKAFDAQTGALISTISRAGSNASFTLTLNTTAGYRVEFTGSCNGKVCKCEYWIKPKPGTTCDCNTDMYVIANPGILKVRCNEKKYFNYHTAITLTPQNICNPADCLTQWSMRIFDSQTGAPVPGGTGTGNSSPFSFTLNSVYGYRIEFVGVCNGKKCICQFWIQTKALP